MECVGHALVCQGCHCAVHNLVQESPRKEAKEKIALACSLARHNT